MRDNAYSAVEDVAIMRACITLVKSSPASQTEQCMIPKPMKIEMGAATTVINSFEIGNVRSTIMVAPYVYRVK